MCLDFTRFFFCYTSGIVTEVEKNYQFFLELQEEEGQFDFYYWFFTNRGEFLVPVEKEPFFRRQMVFAVSSEFLGDNGAMKF